MTVTTSTTRTPRAPRRVGPDYRYLPVYSFSFSTRATSEAVRSGLPIIHSLACLWALDVFDLPRREDHRALARGSQVEPCVILCDSTPANGVNFSARVSAEYVCVVNDRCENGEAGRADARNHLKF